MAQSVIAGPDKNPTVVNRWGVGVRVGFEGFGRRYLER